VTITGSAGTRDVQVEVHPGGALAALRITEQALRRGGPALAETLLSLVRRATAEADQRARHGLSLDDRAADVLGLTTDADLTEAVETTTPDSWRQQ
jgi:hypothetical protein